MSGDVSLFCRAAPRGGTIQPSAFGPAPFSLLALSICMTPIDSLPPLVDEPAAPEHVPVPASADSPGADAADAAAADEGALAQREPIRAEAPADAGPRLRTLFPALFGHPAKPLKLQIQNDIQARAPGEFSKKALSAFFRRYTGSHAYLNAVAHAKSRFDLDGQPAGELSAEHRGAAVQELARRRANQQARVELEEQQRRNRATLLRDFQSTTLTPANFCALKGVAVDALDGLLAVAQAEADERSRHAHAPPHGPHHRDPRAGGARTGAPRGAPERRGPGDRSVAETRRR